MAHCVAAGWRRGELRDVIRWAGPASTTCQISVRHKKPGSMAGFFVFYGIEA